MIISAVLQSTVGRPPLTTRAEATCRAYGCSAQVCVFVCVSQSEHRRWKEVLIPAPQHAEVLAAGWMHLTGSKSQAWRPRLSLETRRSAVFNYKFAAGPLFRSSSTFQIQKEEGEKVQYSIMSADVFLL